MKNIKKYISNLKSQGKSQFEIKPLVKKMFPEFDLRKFPKVWRQLDSIKNDKVISIDRIKEPPMELKPEAYAVWVNFWKTKSADVDIIAMDHYLIASFCIEYAVYQEMREIIGEVGATFKTPKGYVQVRPEVTLGNKALDNAKSIAQEFGYTLKSRMGMGLVKADDKKSDPIEALTKKLAKRT